MSSARNVLGIDIGGSGIKAAPVDTATGTMTGEPFRTALPKSATPEVVCRAVKEIVAHYHWSGEIGCGYPGVIKRGVIFWKLPMWCSH